MIWECLLGDPNESVRLRRVVAGFSHISCWVGWGGADRALGAIPRNSRSSLELEHSQKKALLWVRWECPHGMWEFQAMP